MRRCGPADTPASGVSPASTTNGGPDPATKHGKAPNELSRTSIRKDCAGPAASQALPPILAARPDTCSATSFAGDVVTEIIDEGSRRYDPAASS